MHTSYRSFLFPLVGLLVFACTGCDYTAPEGGTLDVRLGSSSSDIGRAKIAVEHVSTTYNTGREFDHFKQGENAMGTKNQVGIIPVQRSSDTLLTRYQVLPGDFNQLRVVIADTAVVYKQNAEGKSVQTKVGLPTQSAGNLLFEFDPILLDSEGERAEIELEIDLDESITRKNGAFEFRPEVEMRSITVNGKSR